jgi:hypothetical protein
MRQIAAFFSGLSGEWRRLPLRRVVCHIEWNVFPISVLDSERTPIMTRFLSRASLAIASVAIVVLAAQIADAQGGGGRGGQRRVGGFGGRGGTSLVSLAGNAEVQTLLKITDAQKEKVTAINEKLTADRQELFQGGGGGGPEMLTEMQKLAADADAKVAEALDETQNTNILSVLIQAQGGAAATNAQLQKRLKITDAQKSQLAEVAANAPRGRGRRGGADMTAEEQAAAREAASKPYVDILTAEQKADWAKLEKAQAVPDTLLASLRAGGRGRGRGGRGGGGGGGGGGGM